MATIKNKPMKLVKIQAELKAPKNQMNAFGKYKYRSAEDIIEAVKPILFKNNCALLISDEIVQVADRVYVKATAMLIDENNEELPIQVYGWAREEEVKKGMLLLKHDFLAIVKHQNLIIEELKKQVVMPIVGEADIYDQTI